MKDETRENLINPNIWIRALNMVLFMFAYGLAKAIIVFVAFFQFISVLVTGGANLPLLRFGKNLSVFIYEILEFQTFNTEIRPFPFSAWPEEDHGGDIWLDEPSFEETAFEEDNVVDAEIAEEDNTEEETVDAEQASSEETESKPKDK